MPKPGSKEDLRKKYNLRGTIFYYLEISLFAQTLKILYYEKNIFIYFIGNFLHGCKIAKCGSGS